MARVRAEESRRPDRLFDDPYAQAFLAAAAPGAFPDERAVAGGLAWLGAVFYSHGLLRTRFFDDYLLTATTAGYRQVVLLAAGPDTRAFRRSARPRLQRLTDRRQALRKARLARQELSKAGDDPAEIRLRQGFIRRDELREREQDPGRHPQCAADHPGKLAAAVQSDLRTRPVGLQNPAFVTRPARTR